MLMKGLAMLSVELISLRHHALSSKSAMRNHILRRVQFSILTLSKQVTTIQLWLTRALIKLVQLAILVSFPTIPRQTGRCTCAEAPMFGPSSLRTRRPLSGHLQRLSKDKNVHQSHEPLCTEDFLLTAAKPLPVVAPVLCVSDCKQSGEIPAESNTAYLVVGHNVTNRLLEI